MQGRSRALSACLENLVGRPQRSAEILPPCAAGEENLDFVDSLRQSKRIRLIVTRHEQAAAMMAATVGRLTGPNPATPHHHLTG